VAEKASSQRQLKVPKEEAGVRVDIFLATHHPQVSRSALQHLIKEGKVTVQGKTVKPHHKLQAGDLVVCEIPQAETIRLQPEALPLDIRYEDDDLMVINKPQGMAVHPGAGRALGTLANALLARYPELSQTGEEFRPGIIHRLDKDTSGLLVVARNEAARLALIEQMRARKIERRYQALVWGSVPDPELGQQFLRIDAPIGRHPTRRTRMAVLRQSDLERGAARPAATRVAIKERFLKFTLVEAILETGRTHQIRVHLAYLGHPVVGDPVYGARKAKANLRSVSQEIRQSIGDLPGQALHAYFLAFEHPKTGEKLHFESELPASMARLLSKLRANS